MGAPDRDMANALIDKARADRERRRSGRSRTTALVTAAVVGGIGLLLALTAGGDPDEAPDCDDRTMTRDDGCVIYSNRGGGGSFSYEEMIDRREQGVAVRRGIGFGLAGLCAVLMIPAAVRLDPSRPWGAPADGPCSRCGTVFLRERKTTHTVSRGGTGYHVTGVVALCALCGFSSVRRS
ncbi:hypothetical protein [Streptomyces sp. NPDC059092]|uniref:hypothetical protein n=1 Tax=Streptomyces sp. NPDC059092 TaxID=3346725 RepID=UPI0036A8E6C0